jgi:mannose-6-phosphate isomerase
MKLHFAATEDRATVFTKVESYLDKLSLKITSQDMDRPWGGFFVIDSSSLEPFIKIYFPDIDHKQIGMYGSTLSPKILLVSPKQKLSWQYHHRRAEIWKIVLGPVGIIQSNDNSQSPVKPYETGAVVSHGPEIRHRLVGLDGWGVVAEIWQHTDPAHPSNEEDIVRLEDNYGRS